MDIQLPANVQDILEKLHNSGYEAFVVGGCVRDSIIGRIPGDWDITTSAKPDEIKRLFEKTIDTGARHGTITVVYNSENYEVTTYRVDGEYKDNRRPSFVAFTASITEDLSRRDFTANAIAYNRQRGFVDPFGGIQDIHGRILKAVGDAGQRYGEDALRMLRAVRFSAQLGFELEESTLNAIKFNCHLIQNVSKERIRDELTKLIVSDNPSKFHILRDTGLLKFILPELESVFLAEYKGIGNSNSVAECVLGALVHMEKDKILRWAMLLHHIGKTNTETVENVLRELRFDSNSRTKILRLVRYQDVEIEPSEISVKKTVVSVGEDIFTMLLELKHNINKFRNEAKSQEQPYCSSKILSIYQKIKEKGHCLSMKDLEINGDDLIKLGVKPGKELGELLNEAFMLVLEQPELNNKERLIQILRLG